MNDVGALTRDGSMVLSSIKPSLPYEHLLTFPVRINDNQDLLRERNRDGMYVYPEVPIAS